MTITKCAYEGMDGVVTQGDSAVQALGKGHGADRSVEGWGLDKKDLAAVLLDTCP